MVGGGGSVPCTDEETAGASVVTVELEGACYHVIGGDPCTKWITNDK